MASEDERIAELESRIEHLEAQLPDGVSRRDALKLGGVGLLGALGGGGAALGATGTAEAGTYQAGSLGTPDNPLDLTVDDMSVVDSAGNETGHVDASGAQYNSVNGAHQVSEYGSPQDAVDAAGTGGVVVFDAAFGGSISSEISWYDNQTVILKTDLEGGFAGQFFDFSGHTGIKLVPNGHELDGLDRTGDTARGVDLSNATDCQIIGTLRVTRTERFAVDMKGTSDCTVGTVVGTQLGDRSNNNNYGDVVYLRGNDGNNTVETVVGNDVSRHTLTFAGDDTNYAEGNTIGQVNSVNSGGSHVSFEAGKDNHIGQVYGRGARQAATYSSPGSTYNTYPEIAFLNNVTGSQSNTVESVTSVNPAGTGMGLGFGTEANNNKIGSFKSVNATGKAVEFSYSAGPATGNKIEKVEIVGASSIGVYNALGDNHVANGLIKNCDEEGVRNRGDQLTVENLTVRNNAQNPSRTATGIRAENGSTVVARNCIVEDTQGTSTQTNGFVTADSGTVLYVWDPDIENSPTAYNFATKAFVNGVWEKGSAPADADVIKSEAGYKVLDTSTSPSDIYYIRQDGTVDGAL